MDLFKLADELYTFLINEGIKFNIDGYPIITENMIFRALPDSIVPFGQTYSAKDKKNTLLVSFCNDEIIYRMLMRVRNDVDYYNQFMGFGGFDLSPRINWDVSLQRFNLAVCKMADVFLAVNGIKLMPNFRTGCLDTINVLNCYPSHSWYVVGALGCANGHVPLNEMYLRAKLMITSPDHLIYYGKLKPEYSRILNEFNIPYKVFTDFQRRSRGKEVA